MQNNQNTEKILFPLKPIKKCLIFNFEAEALIDVQRLLSLLSWKQIIDLKISNFQKSSSHLHVIIRANMAETDFKEALSQVVDSHVMQRTLRIMVE